MDLVAKSGKFSKKFVAFTGAPYDELWTKEPSWLLLFPLVWQRCLLLLIKYYTCNLHITCLVNAGTSDPLGKRLNNSKTREEIGWEPEYPSFAHFLGVSK
jgi:hypothetical protein